MSKHSSDPFAEHLSIMKSLYHEYQRRDEIESLRSVEMLLKETMDVQNLRKEQGLILIKNLSCSVMDLEALSVYPESQNFHQKRIEALQKDGEATAGALISVEREIKMHEDQLLQVAERARNAMARRQGLERTVSTEEPFLRHQLSLFAHISKITWKLDREESVAGTVSDQKSGDLRPFDVPDSQSLSQYELVNKLWQVL
ncbi:hypothetical protein CEUSTIGMA_g10935.t1 [Chlamydomonas eustigma]|uniref:Kinetochore protein Spc24 n=1 Tax=Chlamydomonas eustigma TaxID=1157962 RepID=A0A250XL55_9CHLO|nr:hypothetical protein CEUSTIGMA_g10935.t1 [Chlamydomonas eustigma]|eukprot:GAX83510.1 hypothetical protein CEUSTIGMA_g10935.t1 [Chlamydomonas eustigma]